MTDQLELWPEEAPGERLNWSWSRSERLRACARRYYLHHYASRGGWEPGAPRAARETYVLRQLQSRYVWVGKVVHELIELALGSWRRGESVAVEGLVERGTRRMRAQYAESIQGVYWDRPMAACGLIEHEYGESIPREEWQAQRDRMERCVRAFFALPLIEGVRRLPTWRWLAVESLGSFDLEGATVVVRPDFAWRGEGNRVFIADWKTGRERPEEERQQLATYGLYARRNWGFGDAGITAVAVHLDTAGGDASVSEYPLGAPDLAAAEERVRTSAAAMRALASEASNPERFPMTEDRDRCRSCSFRRLCGR